MGYAFMFLLLVACIDSDGFPNDPAFPIKAFYVWNGKGLDMIIIPVC